MTAEQFGKQQRAIAEAWNQANLRSLARMCNTTPEKIEEAFARIEADPDSSVRRIQRAGELFGERLAEAFRPFLRLYR